ncbi:hypothetical protein [Methanothrix soehngenii]|jgi:hypothetical protein|uniref:hypothetical protein n=1 Tax=Methanothrix soehngenii TaxID=2223 RepID=UPI003142072D
MNGYGKHDEMKAVLHEWTGTGVRDIKVVQSLKGDTIWLLTDKGEKYIGCTRSEWEIIRDSATMPDNKYMIEGINCEIAYGPGEYLIFRVTKSA